MKPLAILVLACLLFVAPPASAALIELPLLVEADRDNPSVGDAVTFTVSPRNDSAREAHRSQTYRVEYTHDGENEGDVVARPIGNVTLDTAAEGTFTWTIPADAKDRNAFVAIMDGEEGVGSAHVAVENAPPVMFAAGDDGMVAEPPTGGAREDEPEESGENERGVPFVGLPFLVMAIAAAVLVLQRRR